MENVPSPRYATILVLLCVPSDSILPYMTLDSSFKRSRLRLVYIYVSDFICGLTSAVASCWLVHIFALCVPELGCTANCQLG